MPASIPFSFVDVFADAPLTGNPLALVPEADGIDEQQMRAIAREFNLSETTFLLRPTIPDATVRLRSFTPAGFEVGGAGHNALGAWIWLADTERVAEGQFAQQIGARVLPVSVKRGIDGRAVVTMQQQAPEFGQTITARAELARSLGIEEQDLAVAPARVVSTGVGHLIVPVRTRAVVDGTIPSVSSLRAILSAVGAEGCYVYSEDPIDPESGAVAYARFFNPTVGIVEDPATGTAAGPLLAALVERHAVPSPVEAVIEQGYAMGRPSAVHVTLADGQVSLSGSGLIVAEGVLHLPSAA